MNFQGILKQSTSVNITVLIIDSADHITGKTGATLTIYLTKAGGTPASIAPTVTELDSTNVKGLYKLALSTTSWTDTLGEMQLHITGTGCDPADYKWLVSARLIDDLAFPATSGRSVVVDASGLVDANMVKAGPTGSGTAQTAGDIYSKVTGLTFTVANQVDVNVKDWNGTGVSAVTAGIPDVNTKNINNVAAATPGASGGILISGSNAGTTTFGALTVTGVTTLTGNFILSDGITISAPSTGNRAGITITGNGTGAGVSITSGSGASGNGLDLICNSTNGSGLSSAGKGTGNGFKITSISGDGINITVSTSGHGIATSAQGNAKHGIYGLANGGTTASGIRGTTLGGASGAGIYADTGGNAGVGIYAIGGGSGANGAGIKATGGTDFSGIECVGTGTGSGIIATGGVSAGGDGLKCVAGGGVDLRANITGNVTGNLSGSVGSVTSGVTVTTNNDKTGYTIAVGGIGATSFAANAIDSAALATSAANEIADAFLDRADAIETGLTIRGAFRLNSAALAGVLSGAATTTVTINNAVANTKARLTATVDANGNRSAVSTDVT
jgi:hypothetical protein